MAKLGLIIGLGLLLGLLGAALLGFLIPIKPTVNNVVVSSILSDNDASAEKPVPPSVPTDAIAKPAKSVPHAPAKVPPKKVPVVQPLSFGPVINNKLLMNRIYFFYASDIHTTGTGAARSWNFYHLTRRTGSPDPLNTDRNTMHVVILMEEPHGTVFPPNQTLTGTLLEADMRPLFYSTPARVAAATLHECGHLATNVSKHVLCGSLTMPAREGEFRLGWVDNSPQLKRHGNELFFELGPLDAELEVSCDDDIFCNGRELFIRGGCHASTGDPCIFGADPCLQHTCDEAQKLCSPESLGTNCAVCGPICKPKCDKAQKCGSGGCPVCEGGETPETANCALNSFCGTCDVAGESCVAGQCVVVLPSNEQGSCGNPYSLFRNATKNTIELTRSYHVAGNAFPADKMTVPRGGTMIRIEVPHVTNMEDNATTTCGAPGVQEHIFNFTIGDYGVASTGQGVEVMMLGLTEIDLTADNTEERFPNGAIDVLLAFHKSGNCEPLSAQGAAYSICSDDATPPGNLASHLYTRLTNGTYTLVATFFGAQTGGPYVLLIKFTDALSTCFPQCDGKYCGIDECQMEVGGNAVYTTCGLEEYWGLPKCNFGTECVGGRCSNCTADFIASDNYTTTCPPGEGSCGFDQCNQICNKKELRGEPACTKGAKACDLGEKKCVTITECDNAAPECKGAKKGRTEERFCGSDCELYRAYDGLPDLVPEGQAEMLDSIVFNNRTFSNATCGIPEGCLGTVNATEMANGTFTRFLMRFDTNVINLAQGFKPPAINEAPHLFKDSTCHGHAHFGSFAHFDMMRMGNVTSVHDLNNIIAGGKLAYCMEDSSPYYSNPITPCNGVSWCGDQGIQYGWFDRYPADLDCQWLVLDTLYNITGNKGGWYIYRVCTNFGRAFMEKTFNNNCRAFPIYVPDKSEIIGSNVPVSYKDYTTTHKTTICAKLAYSLPLPYGVEYPIVCA